MGKLFIPYNADGLIIANAEWGQLDIRSLARETIIAPQLEAILLTPIAPHSLTVRPFIADGNAENNRQKLRAAYQSVDVFFVDGQRENAQSHR